MHADKFKKLGLVIGI